MTDRLLLTIGNPCGIGPEVLARVLSGLEPVLQSRFTVIGDPVSLATWFHGLECRLHPVEDGGRYQPLPGQPDEQSGHYSWLFLEEAVRLLKSGEAGGVVTAPVSKEWVVRSGQKKFIDHTSYFSEAFACPDVNMLFYSPGFSTILSTIHIPLSQVAGKLTPAVFDRAMLNAWGFGRQIYGDNLKIAVCGLNPHAGENGLLGREEKMWLNASVASWKQRGCPAEGCLPADTVFYRAHKGDYNMVVAQYHDQALAPFKLLHFHDGVNVTLGLPVVRTSPDHGTAFELAGKGQADAGSMGHAVALALRLLKVSA